MWIRVELKARAKSALRVSYWKAFLVSLLIAVAGGSSGSPSFNWSFGGSSYNGSANPFHYVYHDFFPYLIIFFFFIAIILALVIFAFRVLLGYPLEAGGRRYFIRSAQGEVNMNHLGYAFEKGRYLDIVKAMLWRALFNFLWFLLFVIPGIVKSYSYAMVPYILADNPNIGYQRALELSKKMTYGYKFAMWVLDLSFIGWYLLGALALFVGMLFVLPCENATKAELYIVLRQNALDNAICSPEELLQ